MVNREDLESFLVRLGAEGASYSEVEPGMFVVRPGGTDLVHGAYGISANDIILTEALELANLDFSEFLAAYESMTLALASHVRELALFREVH